MSWIDMVGAICAQRHSNRICVTASIDALHFIHPLELGDTATLFARIVYTGRTSMMISVDVYAENPIRRIKAQCVKAYLTFVALGEDRKPTPVPELLLTTESEKQAYADAKERRKALLAQSRS
ncbi:MAG: acyl-CoA thioesterase [Bradymonadales bacterium]|nr:MAG: acyl-CoA thioesterase [Bradymonadales bacterium]